MTAGMLWFDDDPKTTLAQKIAKAMAYYQKKFGRMPELCLVHPNMLKDAKVDEIPGITVRPYRPVLPGHIWIGYEDTPTESILESEPA